jgi:hypothetical protein
MVTPLIFPSLVLPGKLEELAYLGTFMGLKKALLARSPFVGTTVHHVPASSRSVVDGRICQFECRWRHVSVEYTLKIANHYPAIRIPVGEVSKGMQIVRRFDIIG